MTDVVFNFTIIDHKIIYYMSKPRQASKSFECIAVIVLQDREEAIWHTQVFVPAKGCDKGDEYLAFLV